MPRYYPHKVIGMLPVAPESINNQVRGPVSVQITGTSHVTLIPDPGPQWQIVITGIHATINGTMNPTLISIQQDSQAPQWQFVLNPVSNQTPDFAYSIVLDPNWLLDVGSSLVVYANVSTSVYLNVNYYIAASGQR